MISDADITAHLNDEVRAIPYPGRWLSPPFEGDGAAVIARDAGLSELRVDRQTGRIDGVDLPTGAARVIAPSPHALGALAAAYASASRSTRGASDQALERIEQTLLEAIRAVSSELAAAGSFWAIAAEELGNGVLGADAAEPVVVSASGGPTVVIAMPMMRLREALAAEGLGLLDYRASVSYAALSGDLGTTLANTARPGAQTSGPAQVLVVDPQTRLTADDLAFPTLRMLVLLHPAALPADLLDGAARLEVVTVGGPGPFARIADLVTRRDA
ncbi:hypothetical protein [Prescottella agglutinans]|uniref:Uncharacterized protein n=1 Tax=Prescottella agglutinans TaxID=1644129 RepID=A0ABT6MD67_9NOCA|nr:hypothetical protein [Prescottella agglutinans]MDH6282258.1 hypothetical protein [Prescottella agglutinans]